MKRSSKESSRAMRAGDTSERDSTSRYAQKVEAGNQMYGSKDKRKNCCAHNIKLDYWAG